MDIAFGLGYLVVIGVVGTTAWFVEIAFVRRMLLGMAILLWAIGCFAFIAVLAVEHSDVSRFGSISCPVSSADSTYAPSHWSSVPPGEVCEYAAGDVGPGYWRVVTAVGLIVLPLSAIVAWPRRRSPARAEVAVNA
jgi:hypothetical protein